MFHPRLTAFIAALVTLLVSSSAVAQSTDSTASAPVKQAAFTRPATSEAGPQTAHFGRRVSRIGDQTEQTMSLEMQMKLTMRHENEVVGKHQTTVRTTQRRIVTATAVDAGSTTAVRVTYPEATKQVVAADAPTTPAQPGEAAAPEAIAQYQPVAQSVQGKTYLCHRTPGDDSVLIVTDEAGNRPPTEEYEIVAPQMDVVGRPNPLAQYLAGRTIAVGDKLELPKDIASKVFNLGDKFGEVTKFTMTLKKVQSDNGAECAEFLANVEAAAVGASQMRLEVEGPLTVDCESCRAVHVGLVGPIGMSETRGSYSTAYQVIGTGRLQMTIASTYREVPQQ